MPPWQRRVGLLRQDPGLFPHLSVRANLRYSQTASRDPAELSRAGRHARPGRAAAGHARPAVRRPGRTASRSAGCCWPTATRCCWTSRTPAWTPSLRRSLTELVVRLVTERGIPAVLVAHELADAQAFANRLAVIDRGGLLQDGPPDEVVLQARVAAGR